MLTSCVLFFGGTYASLLLHLYPHSYMNTRHGHFLEHAMEPSSQRYSQLWIHLQTLVGVQMSGKSGPTIRSRQNMKRVIWYHLMDWYTSATAIHTVSIAGQLVINQRKILQVSLERFCSTFSIFSQHYKLTDFVSLSLNNSSWGMEASMDTHGLLFWKPRTN